MLKEESEKMSKSKFNVDNPDDIVVRLPNLEIKDCFTKNIQKRFKDVFVNLELPGKFVNALVKGQQVDISNILFVLIVNYFSSILWCEDDMIFAHPFCMCE